MPDQRRSCPTTILATILHPRAAEVRKATLASVLTKATPGLRLNEHIEADERCSPTPARWDSKAFSNGRSYRDRRELISLLGGRRAHGRINRDCLASLTDVCLIPTSGGKADIPGSRVRAKADRY
jgi:hypothetical protein